MVFLSFDIGRHFFLFFTSLFVFPFVFQHLFLHFCISLYQSLSLILNQILNILITWTTFNYISLDGLQLNLLMFCWTSIFLGFNFIFPEEIAATLRWSCFYVGLMEVLLVSCNNLGSILQRAMLRKATVLTKGLWFF